MFLFKIPKFWDQNIVASCLLSRILVSKAFVYYDPEIRSMVTLHQYSYFSHSTTIDRPCQLFIQYIWKKNPHHETNYLVPNLIEMKFQFDPTKTMYEDETTFEDAHYIIAKCEEMDECHECSFIE